MFFAPASRSRPIARFRKAAMAWAAAPLRTRERSSSKVTSLTQWSRFSMLQWPRANPRILDGGAFGGVRLVIP